MVGVASERTRRLSGDIGYVVESAVRGRAGSPVLSEVWRWIQEMVPDEVWLATFRKDVESSLSSS
jgi:hypothetical protein